MRCGSKVKRVAVWHLAEEKAMITQVKSTFRYNLRSDGGMLLEDYSARSNNTLGDRAFKIAALKIATPKIYRRTLESRKTMIFLRNS